MHVRDVLPLATAGSCNLMWLNLWFKPGTLQLKERLFGVYV